MPFALVMFTRSGKKSMRTRKLCIRLFIGGILFILLKSFLQNEQRFLWFESGQELFQHRNRRNKAKLQVQKNWSCNSLRPKMKFFNFPSFHTACNQTKQCLRDKKIKWRMIIFVKSHGENFDKRARIRRTWGSVRYLLGGQFYLIFIVGIVEEYIQHYLDEEIRRQGDILQIDLLDVYGTIAQKTLAGMQWAGRYLPDDYLYSSADDDVVVNWVSLAKHVNAYFSLLSKLQWPEFPLLCMFNYRKNEPPNRNSSSKYYMPLSHYKWPYFPKYCLGGMYTTSVSVAQKLWHASRTEHTLLMDDVWITGLLREKIQMPTEMVVSVKPSGAFHFYKEEYADKNATELWGKLIRTLDNSSICFCT